MLKRVRTLEDLRRACYTHTLSAVTEGLPPPAEVIVKSIRTSQVGPIPSSIANLAIIPPDVD
eukprot:1416477-Amphidinium_carterae.1